MLFRLSRLVDRLPISVDGVRRGFSPLVVALILLFSVIAQDSTIFASLRGESRVEDDLKQGPTGGYYENLIGANEPVLHKGPRRVAKSSEKGSVATPAVIPFRDAGIVLDSPTYVRWRMRPNLAIRWNESTFRTNSQGYRTPEIALPKPEGTYRVLCFGSSNTMGHGVEEEQTYPRLLEGWLRKRLGSSRKVDVVNLAVSGDSPTRRLQRLREDAERYQADWFLCEATALDYLLEEEHLQMVVRKEIPIPLDFVHAIVVRTGVTAADSKDAFHRKLKGESDALLDGAYAGWSDAAKSLQTPLAVAMLPRSDRNVESPRMFRLMRTLCERYGLDCLDLTAAFHGLSEKQIQVSPWDNHPSALGHERIFDSLCNILKRRGGPPGLSLSRPESARVLK